MPWEAHPTAFFARRRSLGVSIQVVGSSFDIEGSSDEAGGRASEDLERGSDDGRASSGVVGGPFEVA